MSQLVVSRCFCYSSRSETDGSSQLVAIIPCGHVHHKTCLATWWQRNRTCPSCNQTVTHRPGTVDLFGLAPHSSTAAPSSDAALVPSSPRDTTNALADKYNRTTTKTNKRKRVVHDDEDEDDDQDGDGARDKDLERRLTAAVRDAEAYRRHGTDLEDRLTEFESEVDALRNENDALKDELARLDADVLEDLEELNARVEEDNRLKAREIDKLKVKLDQRDRKSFEHKNRIRTLEAQLANEGDSGRRRIDALEHEIDEGERKLMHVRAEKDKLELEIENLKGEIQNVKERAEKKIDACKSEAKERLHKAEVLTKHAIEDLKKEQDHSAAIKSGLRSFEQKYKKLQKKFKLLQDKRQKVVVESDSDSDDLDPTMASPRRLQRGPDRKPLDPLPLGASNNLDMRFGSSPPAYANAFKIKNNAALRSPSKTMTIRGFLTDLGKQQSDLYGENAILLPERGDDDDEEKEKEEDDTKEENSDDDIEIIEPPTTTARSHNSTSSGSREARTAATRRQRRQPLEFVPDHHHDDDPLPQPPPSSSREEGVTVASKYFASSTGSSAARLRLVDQNPSFPSLFASANSVDGMRNYHDNNSCHRRRRREGEDDDDVGNDDDVDNRGLTIGRRTGNKSDKHLPDFARGTLVQTGPKVKIRRRG